MINTVIAQEGLGNYRSIFMNTFNYEERWASSPLDYDYPLTEKQYRIFVKGFTPEVDHRYEPISVDGWHYVKLLKLKVEESFLDDVIFNSDFDKPLFTEAELKEIGKKNGRNKA